MNIKPKKPTNKKRIAYVNKNVYERVCRIEVAYVDGERDFNGNLLREEDGIYRLHIDPLSKAKYSFFLRTDDKLVTVTSNKFNIISFHYDNFHVSREIRNDGMTEAYSFSFINCNKYKKIVISFGAPNKLLRN